MRRPTISRWIVIAALVPVVVCVTLLDSHLDRPTHFVFGGIALLYLALVAGRLFEHGRFVRSLRRLAFDGELGGVPVKYVNGVAPFVAGIVRPRMYCDPELVHTLTVRQQRAVALHERYHLQRRDPLRLQLSTALRPLVILLPRLHDRLDAHQVRYEVAADRFALRHGATRADLAGALLAMLEDGRLHLAPGFISAAEIRLRALTGDPLAGSETSKGATVMLGLAASAVIACLVLL
jgi:beta-lactamase regulating signal transducer with metallopeptidase domain